jgi:hypothetical protein
MRTTSLLSIALVAAIGLSGCTGTSTESGPADAASSSTPSSPRTPSSESSSEPSSEPSAAPGTTASGAATPGATPGATPDATADAAPAADATARPDVGPSLRDPSTQLLTTTDGLYSFVLPVDWKAMTVEPATAPDYGAGLSRTAYSILDGTGVEVATFAGGVPGDGGALPSPGHVLLDSEELPGLSQQVETVDLPVSYVFDHYRDPVTGGTVYLARLHLGPLPADGTYGIPLGAVPLGSNGLVVFTARFDETRFADPAAARAWMASGEYAAVKAMFTSLTFNG